MMKMSPIWVHLNWPGEVEVVGFGVVKGVRWQGWVGKEMGREG
jgi:hypothetical protein